MSGPVWRFEGNREATCTVCFRTVTGVFAEGEVADNEFRGERQICPACYGRTNRMIVHGEMGVSAPAPAYARR